MVCKKRSTRSVPDDEVQKALVMLMEEQRLYTVDDLRQIENLPGNEDKWFELIAGVIYEVARPSPLHTYMMGETFAYIRNFNREHDLGWAFGDGHSYFLTPTDEPAPDVSFVSKLRAPTLPDRFTFAPDLAIEIMSPSNRDAEMLDKVELYLQHGSKLVWVFNPKPRTVYVWRKVNGGMLTHKMGMDGVLDGEDVLPGFRLAVKDVFPKS
jgi:Uma2 family endonuclease